MDQTIALFCRNQTSLICFIFPREIERNGLSRSGSQAVTPLFPLKQPEPGISLGDLSFQVQCSRQHLENYYLSEDSWPPEQHEFQLWGQARSAPTEVAAPWMRTRASLSPRFHTPAKNFRLPPAVKRASSCTTLVWPQWVLQLQSEMNGPKQLVNIYALTYRDFLGHHFQRHMFLKVLTKGMQLLFGVFNNSLLCARSFTYYF